MKAGKLNHRITFIQYNQVPDGAGGTIPVPETIYNTQANVKPLRNDRTLQGNQDSLRGGYEIYFRYRRDVPITKQMYIRYKDQELTLNTIQQWEEDRRMWYVIAMVRQ